MFVVNLFSFQRSEARFALASGLPDSVLCEYMLSHIPCQGLFATFLKEVILSVSPSPLDSEGDYSEVRVKGQALFSTFFKKGVSHLYLYINRIKYMLCVTRDYAIMEVQKEIPPLHCRFGNLTGDARVESPS